MTFTEMMYLENKKYSEGKTSKKKVVKESVKYSESDILDKLFDLFKESNEVLVGPKGYYTSSRSYTFDQDKDNWTSIYTQVRVNLDSYVGDYNINGDSFSDQINYRVYCDGVYYKGVVDVDNKKIGYDGTKIPFKRDNVVRDLSEDEVRDYLLKGLNKFINDLSRTVNKNRGKVRKDLSIKVKHPTNDQTRNARYFGNPYDGQFSSEEERQAAIKSYERSISAAETRLGNHADFYRSQGGYDRWHEDKDSIGYMYDRLALMKSAKLK